MSGGLFFATIFFILLTFTAWTSALGLIEPAVAWIMETHYKSRRQSAVIVGGLIWFLGMGSVLSFSELSDFQFLRGTIYQNVDYLTSNVMLPLSGVLIAVFAAWVMCRNSTSEELGGVGTIYKTWRFSARFIAPIAILFIFLQAIGVL
jgi:NSS family neurotransmitter:Na+ symporter